MPAGALVEPGKAPRIQKHSVRIVQLAQRPVDRMSIQSGIRQGVHKITSDVLQHGLEQVRTRRQITRGSAGATLHEPAARDERTGEHCRRRDASILH